MYAVIEKMPKKDKYTLGEKVQSSTLAMLELLIQGGWAKKDEKSYYLDKANVKLDLLKLLIRLSKDVKAIPEKHYLKLEEDLQEIGKMLGGWIRSLR